MHIKTEIQHLYTKGLERLTNRDQHQIYLFVEKKETSHSVGDIVGESRQLAEPPWKTVE